MTVLRNLYLTPNTPAELRREFFLVPLPNIPEIKEAFWGAIAAVAFQTRWDESGDMSVLETTQWLKRAIVESRRMMFHIGMIIPTLQDPLDDDLLLADGSIVSQADYPELAEVIGAQYLDGSDILLPDLRGLFIIGVSDSIAVDSQGGEASHTLTESEMPSHNHSQNPHAHTYTETLVLPSVGGIEPVPAVDAFLSPGITGLETATNNPTGGGQPHNNMPPYYALRYAIVAR